MLFGCAQKKSSTRPFEILRPKEPIASRRHYVHSLASPDSARIVADVQSADDPSGHLRRAFVQFRPVDGGNFADTMVEETAVAGRYWRNLIVPGSYILRVRQVGYSMIID